MVDPAPANDADHGSRSRPRDRDAQRALRILESALDYAIIGTDLDGLITSWSAGAETVLGWTKQQVIGRNADLFFTPEDRAHDIPECEMQAALETGSAVDERWHLRSDKTRFWANGRLTPLRDETGVVQGYVKILRDRTEAREQILRQDADAAFLRSVLAASQDCIKVLDRAGRITFVNNVAERVLGALHPGSLVGLDWASIWPEGTQGRARNAIDAALLGDTVSFQGRTRSPDGAERCWDVRAVPVRDPGSATPKVLVVSRDVTDRAMADEALRRSEAHWRGLFERLHEGFVLGELVRDTVGRPTDWRYLAANPAWEALTGLSREAAIGRTARDLIPSLEDIWLESFAQAVQSGHPISFVSPVDAIGRWFDCHAYALDHDRFAVLFIDNTEQRRADQRRTALLSLGDRLHVMLDPTEMGFVAAEIMGNALDADRAGYGTLEPHGDLVVERDWTAPGMHSLATRHAMRDYGSYMEDLQAGELAVIDDVRRDPRTASDVDELDAVSVASLINVPLIEDGRLVALFFVNKRRPHAWNQEEIAFARSIAERTRGAIERRRAEQALRDLAASLERQVEDRTRERDQLWQASRDLLCIASFEGYLLSLNPAWTATLGWLDTDLQACPLIEFVHPDDRPTTLDAAAALSQGKPQIGFENRYRCRDGSYRWLSWNAVPRDGRIYATVRDVTDAYDQAALTETLAEQLRQSQKTEAVGQLTGGIAHDFNNLLTGISGSLELLGNRIAQRRYGEIERYVAAAQGAASRAASLTHRLLAFSRQQTLDSRPTDIDRLVGDMAELIRRTVGPAIDIVVTADDPGAAQVDPNQLENALLNLCINARDAMPDGGTIAIATAGISLDRAGGQARALPPGRYVTLSVSDTGSGMTPDVIARAFDPFFTTKPIGKGTGLGLSMIYGFARQSGGQAEIESTLGAGTTMTLVLPRHQPADADRNLTSTPPASRLPTDPDRRSSSTILVVDDEPTVRAFIAEVLEDRGYNVLEAADGQSGLAIIQSDARIDLLVTDVGLPGGLNGRQLADAARLARPSLRILFVTGYAESVLVGGGALEPRMHVMTKPFETSALVARIADLTTQQDRVA